MKWTTPVNLPEMPGYVTYQDKILMLGSCFADEIGARLKASTFDSIVNPAGVIFNPLSLSSLIDDSLQSRIDEMLIVERDGSFYHYGYHSCLKAQTKLGLFSKIQKVQSQVKERLMTGSHLFLTLGSAWVYTLKEQNKSVANCHKMDAALFNKSLLDINSGKEAIGLVIERLLRINPRIKVTITVSPVRHVKDGLHENNLSKSVLLLLTHTLMEQFKSINYFPAYEIAVDELRDYRFFKPDLVHPNEQAVDYIYEKFRQVYFDSVTLDIFEVQEKINKALNHRFSDASDQAIALHRAHLEGLQTKVDELKAALSS